MSEVLPTDKSIRLESADGTIFLPEGSVDLPQLTRDMKARVGVVLVGAGLGACGLVVAAEGAINFIRGCYNEQATRALFGYTTTDMVGCVQETVPFLQALLK